MRLSYEQLSKIWRASASENHLTRDDLSSVHIDGASEALLESSATLSLRAEGHFVYGISQIWRNKAHLLLEDSKSAEANIGVAFREYLESIALSSHGGSSRAAALSGLDIGELLNIPESLLSSTTSRSNDPDRSLDLVVRGGEFDMPDDLSEGEKFPRSAEETAVLEGLDFGLDVPNSNNESEMGPGALDFGSDLPYSSSPPHTPRADPEPDVQIDLGDSSPQVREAPSKRRKRGAAIDDITTIVRPRKPMDKILRSPPKALAPTFGLPDDDSYISMDAETEKLLDPDYVEEEMRRRRRSDTAEMEIEEPEESVEFGHVDFADDSLDFGDIGEYENEAEKADDEDTPESLETEQRRARDTIRNALRRRGDSVAFEELATTSSAKASILMEVLHLATNGKVRPTQEKAWGHIDLVKT